MPHTDWSTLAAELSSALHLNSAPLAITFSEAPLPGVPMFEEAMPEITALLENQKRAEAFSDARCAIPHSKESGNCLCRRC